MTPHSISKDMKYSQETVLKHLDYFQKEQKSKGWSSQPEESILLWVVGSLFRKSGFYIFERHIGCGRGISSASGKFDTFDLHKILSGDCSWKKIAIPHNGISLVFVISLIMIT